MQVVLVHVHLPLVRVKEFKILEPVDLYFLFLVFLLEADSDIMLLSCGGIGEVGDVPNILVHFCYKVCVHLF